MHIHDIGAKWGPTHTTFSMAKLHRVFRLISGSYALKKFTQIQAKHREDKKLFNWCLHSECLQSKAH